MVTYGGSRKPRENGASTKLGGPFRVASIGTRSREWGRARRGTRMRGTGQARNNTHEKNLNPLGFKGKKAAEWRHRSGEDTVGTA